MKLKQIKYIILIILIIASKAKADTPVYSYYKMIWLGYFQQIKLKKNYAIHTDLQFRTKDWLSNYSQALIRTGFVYNLNEKINLTIGIAHFRFFITNKSTKAEWRPWQEISFNDQINKLSVKHRFRSEQRFNELLSDELESTSHYSFNWRFRYKLELSYPINNNETKKHYFTLANEIMINAGRLITTNYFNQNRFSIGFNFQLNESFYLQPQFIYINQFIKKSASLDNITVLRFNILHKI
jgi:hypothetical protein